VAHLEKAEEDASLQRRKIHTAEGSPVPDISQDLQSCALPHSSVGHLTGLAAEATLPNNQNAVPKMVIGFPFMASVGQRALILAIALMAALRVLWAFWIAGTDPGAITTPDSLSYLDSSRALLIDRRFAVEPGSFEPMYIRTPGYPLMLALMQAIFADVRWISGGQAALTALAIVIVYRVGRRAIGPAAGVVAAAIVAVDPLLFQSSGTLLTEGPAALATSLLALTGLQVFTAETTAARIRASFLLGLVLAAATMIRPTTYYLPFLLAPFLLFHMRAWGRARAGAAVLAFGLPILFVVGGWQLRNQQTVGSWRLSGIEAVNLYCYRAAEVHARATGSTLQAAREELACRSLAGEPACPPGWPCPASREEPVGPYLDRMADEGLRILLRHPAETLRMTLAGLGRLLVGPGTLTLAQYLSIPPHPLLTAVLGAWAITLLAGALIGALIVVREGTRLRAWWAFLALVALYIVLVSAGNESYARFRTPVVPVMALFAAAGASRLIAARQWAIAGAERDPPDNFRGVEPVQPGID
jgi:4-amino-4-deoxy-L-arabinose transferase-like glycosyltransferase